MNRLSDETKSLLAAMECFLQDICFYEAEERSSYTVEELATVRKQAIQDWAVVAEQLRNQIGGVFPGVLKLAYPKDRDRFEQEVADGEHDNDIPGLK